jgi:cystathionine beta-lyase family protein involved in aluminum resistance
MSKDKDIDSYLNSAFGISEKVAELVRRAEADVNSVFVKIDEIAEINQYKVLSAFQTNRINNTHFGWETGYGYDDPGRSAVEKLFAAVFGTEASLVRTQIVNGTHAISATLLGILRPGDELIYCTGAPYDTIQATIGIAGNGVGSLKEYGINYKQIELTDDGEFDFSAIKEAIRDCGSGAAMTRVDKTTVVAIQRATGYVARKAITIPQIADLAKFCKEIDPNIILMADNCYGEFLETSEPTDVGVDVIAGSLIKNPGGGLALSGGYIAGRTDLIAKIAYRLICPGIGGECGLTFGQTRSIMQGLFIAPRVTTNALKGAVLCARVFELAGFDVNPAWDEARSDIIETVRLGNADGLVSFCKGIQAAAPIDSYVTPEPWDMPGYDDQVIMAAGAFVSGSSIELSADGPMREPYNVYFQGGLTYEHSKFGVMKALQQLIDDGQTHTSFPPCPSCS